MMLKFEQLEFKFEEGELHAPVSSLYKRFIYEALKSAMYYRSEFIYDFFVDTIRKSFDKDDLLKKTPKDFQEELYSLLDVPLPVIYEKVMNQPFVSSEENKPANINKPKLTLVK